MAVCLKAKIIDLDFQKTLLFVNSIREQQGLKPIQIDQAQNLDEFFKLCDEVKLEDNIIIDVGGFDSELTRMALYIADVVVTPAAERLTELAGLMKFHEIVEDVSRSVETDITAHVLINNVNPNAKDFSVLKAYVEDAPRFKLMETVVHHRADFYKTMEEGKTVCELKKGKAFKEIKKLAKEIKKVAKRKDES